MGREDSREAGIVAREEFFFSADAIDGRRVVSFFFFNVLAGLNKDRGDGTLKERQREFKGRLGDEREKEAELRNLERQSRE